MGFDKSQLMRTVKVLRKKGGADTPEPNQLKKTIRKLREKG